MKTSIVLISGKQGSGKTSIANALQRQIHNAGQKSFVELLNFADVRFENELFAFPDALRVRLECPEDERQVRAEKWRPNTKHASEISLDTLAATDVFDLYLDTSSNGISIEGCVNLIHAQILKGNWKEKRP